MPLTVLSLRWISLIVRTIYSESSSGERILRDKLNISFWIESYWMASLKCLRWAYSRCDDRRLSLNLPNCLKIGWNQPNILRCCLAKRSSKFYGERTLGSVCQLQIVYIQSAPLGRWPCRINSTKRVLAVALEPPKTWRHTVWAHYRFFDYISFVFENRSRKGEKRKHTFSDFPKYERIISELLLKHIIQWPYPEHLGTPG